MRTINLGLVGLGKIARDQHLPAIASNPDYRLIAVTEGATPPPGAAVFKTMHDMLDALPEIEAVSLCTPPRGRHALARHAIDSGRHVIMEKPPCQTLSEVLDLVEAARARNVALFATWHSREAPAVEPARRWLANATIRDITVTWKEDVRRWHPGQQWIWEPGGFGIFDPGINALSILTHIAPRIVFVKSAQLAMPSNRAMPIAASIELSDSAATPIGVELDWRQTGVQTWDIVVNSIDGRLHLRDGGAALSVDGVAASLESAAEYPNLYRRFAQCVRERSIDADVAPLRLVIDALAAGSRTVVEPFHD